MDDRGDEAGPGGAPDGGADGGAVVDFDRWPYPGFIAHRGAGLLAPENTMAALRLGAAHGYRMFEFDVKLSADGVPFLLHDATLDRTTNGRGPAAALTMAELERLDAGSWHGERHAGEPVPTLATVADWLLSNDLMANIEIKPSPGREAETGTAVAIAAARHWRGRRVPPLLSSFSERALEAAGRAAPQLPRALLLDRLPDDWPARLRRLGCVALDAKHRALDAGVIAQAHRAGLRVCAYTVNDPETARTLRAQGVDCVITDRVDGIGP
jgi:glycerophosphoryl diester phosphodiesterase